MVSADLHTPTAYEMETMMNELARGSAKDLRAFRLTLLGKGGRAALRNVDTNKWLRIHEMPKVELCLVPGTVAPTGVGVPGVPPLAPARAFLRRRAPLTGPWPRSCARSSADHGAAG